MRDNNEIDKLLDQENLFKPITEGLGFHHSLKKKVDVEKSLAVKTSELKADFVQRQQKELLKKQVNPVQMGDLAPFYQSQVTEKKSDFTLNETTQIDASEKEPAIAYRFCAWIIDFTIICLSFALTCALALIVSGVSLKFLFSTDLMFKTLCISCLFLFYYMTYYMLMDRQASASFGKKALGLQLSAQDGSIRVSKVLKRSFLSFMSILSLGLICLLNIDSQWSKTKVIFAK